MTRLGNIFFGEGGFIVFTCTVRRKRIYFTLKSDVRITNSAYRVCPRDNNDDQSHLTLVGNRLYLNNPPPRDVYIEKFAF